MKLQRTRRFHRATRQISRRCGQFIDALESRLLLASTAPAAGEMDSWTIGEKSLLFVRAAYADTPTVEPATLAHVQSAMAATNESYRHNSWGLISFKPTFTDVVVLPESKSFYNSAGFHKLRDDALSAAAAANPAWDYRNYALDVVSYSSTSDNLNRGTLGGRGVWLIGAGHHFLAHELGHNLGLHHANQFVPADGSLFGPGAEPIEYGDDIDIMGGGTPPRGHFSTWAKHKFGWLPVSNIATPDQSGVYRIYAHDVNKPRIEGLYALKFERPSSGDAYWVEYRDTWGSTALGMHNGIGIRYVPNNAIGSQALDVPGGLTLGVSYTDPVTGFVVTPLRTVEATATTPQAMDVRVSVGDLSQNRPPVINSVSASATKVNSNTPITFTASATDPDGDELSYTWDLDDIRYIAATGSQITHSFGQDYFKVRLTVSDMNGGIATENFLITAGAPHSSRHTVSGRIVDSAGKPIPDVKVWVDHGDGNHSTAHSDRDGTFDIVTGMSGTFPVVAGDYAYNFTTTNVTIGSSNITGVQLVGTPRFRVWGNVVDANGAAVAGATVSNGSQSTTTNEFGTYELPTGTGWKTITVTKPGFQTASREVSMYYKDTFGNNLTLTATGADTTPPSMPANFRSTAQTASSISLAWSAATDNVGVTGYEVFRNGVRVATLGPSVTSYTDSNLAAGTKYDFGVVALDAAGNRSVAAAVSATTQSGGGGPAAGVAATYYDNMDFTGASVTRTDEKIDFNWGSGGPMAGIGADTFSVRWNGFITAPSSGTYTFYTTTDDGARLSVNNQRIIDKLVPQAATEWSGTINLTAGQRVPVVMEYFDRFGGAVARLSWSGPGISKQVVPASAFGGGGTPVDTTPPTAPTNFHSPSQQSTSLALSWLPSSDNVGVVGYELVRNGVKIATLDRSAMSYSDMGLTAETTYQYVLVALDAAGNRSPAVTTSATTRPEPTSETWGLQATYFDNMDFTGSTVTRRDQQIDFNWGAGSPASGISSDTFSARWEGFITAHVSGTYTFYTTTDDGVKLWVNNQVVIDKLVPQAATEWSGTINLTAGQAVPIRMDYFDRFGGAVARLSWAGPQISKQVVPASAFSTDEDPPPPPPQQQPYMGTPFSDGQLIPAEYFDFGGEGVAYHDTDTGNQAGDFRAEEDVDVAPITGNSVVGRAHQGEWLEYTINSPHSTTRAYKLETHYATPKTDAVLRFLIDGVEAGRMTLASTGSYGGTYATASTTINVAPGTHVLRVEFAGGGNDVGNFDWFRLTSQVEPQQTGTIAGFVWNDADADRLRESGEAMLAGWRVFIDGDGDHTYDEGEISTLTDSSGRYLLTVAPGEYRVYEVVQSGWRRTTSGYHPISMQAGQSYTHKSFGNVRIA